jgi:hypothetical protein
LRKETAVWQGRCVRDIQPPDIHRLLDAVIARGSTIAANRIFAVFRRMFRSAKERRIISTSPCDDIRAPTSERGRARERVLDDGELRLIWKAAETLGFPLANDPAINFDRPAPRRSCGNAMVRARSRNSPLDHTAAASQESSAAAKRERKAASKIATIGG